MSKSSIVKKKMVGIVISDKMDKSRIVIVKGVKKHSTYGKFLKTKKKFMVHDESNKTKIGDKILIQESKPISKRKKWEIVEIVGKA